MREMIEQAIADAYEAGYKRGHGDGVREAEAKAYDRENRQIMRRLETENLLRRFDFDDPDSPHPVPPTDG
jgi:flagellar biosynthesis/type III secretory pathway protein FliH